MGVTVAKAVQSTAFVAAACRAMETGGPRPRLTDRYAALFVAEQESGEATRQRIVAAGADEVIQRSRLLDEALTRRLPEIPGAVVLNLGAGFCARPYRLDLSACRKVVECDAPEIIAVKDRVLAPYVPHCPVERIPIDVRHGLSAGLAAAGDAPVIVLSEGLLVYLPPDDLHALATELAAHPTAVEWLADVVSPASAQGMQRIASQAGAKVDLYGLGSLETVEQTGWVCLDYRILPVPNRGGPVARPPAGPASRQIIDGVVTWRRR